MMVITKGVYLGGDKTGSGGVNNHAFGLREKPKISIAANPYPEIDRLVFHRVLATKEIPLFETKDQQPVKIRMLVIGEPLDVDAKTAPSAEASAAFFRERGLSVHVVALGVDRENQRIYVFENEGDGWRACREAPNAPKFMNEILLLLHTGFDYVRMFSDTGYLIDAESMAKRCLSENGVFFENLTRKPRETAMYEKTYRGIEKTVANFFDEHD